jgi:hypothetical protein
MMWDIQNKERGASMKTKLNQFVSFVSRIDRRHLQFAYLAVLLLTAVVQGPSDGGTGPYKF